MIGVAGSAEKDRIKYRLELSEIQTRKDFVAKTKKAIADMRRVVQDPEVKAKRERQQKQALMGSGVPEPDKYARMRAAINEDNENFVASVQQTQQVPPSPSPMSCVHGCWQQQQQQQKDRMQGGNEGRGHCGE